VNAAACSAASPTMTSSSENASTLGQTALGPTTVTLHPNNAPGASGFWANDTTAWAVSNNGLTQFDDIEVQFTVPEAPPNPSDVTYELEWCGLENFPTAGGAWTSVIQAELRYCTAGYCNGNTADQFYISPEVNVNGGSDYQGYYINVSPGALIDCHVWQTSSTGWEIETTAYQNGWAYYTWINWTPPTGSSWGPYQWSQLAVYENYASACGGLFASDSTSFSTVALEEAGPSWNSFTNFFGLSGATVWSAWYTGGGSQPNCDYGASFNWGSATSTLTWSD
jgi:hypothetical protein